MRGGSGAATGGGRSFLRVSAAVNRLRRWVVRDLFRSRGGGGGGEVGRAPQRVGEVAGGAAGGEGVGTGGNGEGERDAAERAGSAGAAVAI